MKTPQYLLWITVALVAWACSGRGNIDLSKAKPVSAEPVKGNGPNSTVPEGSTQFNSLFAYQPGEVVARKVGTIIDQTGTALVDDYDGDGLKNTDERSSSMWVADYPRIEAAVSTPVTMTIDIEKSEIRENDSITSNITSDDFEDNRDKGTENVHRNETGVRTTQIVDKYSGSSSSAQSVSSGSGEGRYLDGNYGGTVLAIAGGGKSSASSGSSWSKSNSFSETKTTFPDAPATNNLDRDGWSVKANSAAKNARKYRADKNEKIKENSIVKPDAGRVRAALYIKNFSVNMPVRLTNILCTLMFETPTGQLIPMQSFRLRNDDFSLFTLNLYGSSEFGPYVIELANLNTVEVENAIRLGYNPKIFIVDYDISHVPNSNYKAALPGAIGENVKIVEENAKGRTALVKIKGPGIREMYRVAAWEFDAPTDTDPCLLNGSGDFRPGISLENVLKRLNCARANGQLDGVGIDFEAGDYIIDLSDMLPNLPANPKVFVHGIKKLAGIESKVPCAATETKTGSDGLSRTVCRMKKISEFNDANKRDFGMWIVFANGKYYAHSDYVRVGNNIVRFDGTDAGSAAVVRGISSIVWAGDNYDLVYISLQELIDLQGRFGTNPLETNAQLAMNTKWDSAKVGSLDTKYQPDKFSVFLGKAAKGDHVELTFKLNSNKQLQYSFGTATDGTGLKTYKDFNYSINNLTTRFNLTDAVKFELSMGLGGNRDDWRDITDTAKLAPCNGNTNGTIDAAVDFVNQTFTVCFIVPGSDYDYSASGVPTLVNLYLRPKLLDEYRNVIWPEKLAEVKKFKGQINVDAASGATQIQLSNVIGNVEVQDTFKIGTNSTVYTINSVTSDPANPKLLTLSISPQLTVAQKQGDVVKADSAQLLAPQVSVNITNSYFSAWNGYLGSQSGCFPASGCAFDLDFAGQTTGLIGLTYNESNLNWMGRNYFNKDRYDFTTLDASRYVDFLNSDFDELINVPNQTSEKLSMTLTKTVAFGQNQNIDPAATISDYLRPVSNALIGNKAITFWVYRRNVGSTSDPELSELRGQIYDLSTNTAGAQFVVASAANGEVIAPLTGLTQHGNTVVISWFLMQPGSVGVRASSLVIPATGVNNAPQIGGTVAIDSLLLDGFDFGSTGYYERIVRAPSIAINASGNRILIGYHSAYTAYMKLLNLSTNSLSVIDGIDLGHNGSHVSIDIEGNIGYVAFEGYSLAGDTGNNGADYRAHSVHLRRFDIAGSLLADLGETTVLGAQYTVNEDTTITHTDEGRLPILTVKNNKALVLWENLRTPTTRCNGRVVDFNLSGSSIIRPRFTLDMPGYRCQYPKIGSDSTSTKVLIGWYDFVSSGSTTSDTRPALALVDIANTSTAPIIQPIYPESGWYYSLSADFHGTQISCGISDCWWTWTTVVISGAGAGTHFGAHQVNMPAGTFSPYINLSPLSALKPVLAAQTLTGFGYGAYLNYMPVTQEAFMSGNYPIGLSGFGLTNPGLMYGLNNFFVAPLLERNYTVTAKLR